MIMDPRLREVSGSTKGFKVEDTFRDQKPKNGFKVEQSLFDQKNLLNHPIFPPNPLLNPAPSSTVSPQGDSPEDCDMFSDIVLSYISQILMEEDLEEKSCMYQECSALQAAEKPFYDILGEKYPPSPDQPPLYLDGNLESPDTGSSGTDDNIQGSQSKYNSGSNNGGFDSSWISDLVENQSFQKEIVSQEYTYHSTDYTSQPLFNSSNLSSVNNAVEGLDDSLINKLRVRDILSESEHVSQFKRGLEEASKFLPNGNLILDLERNGFARDMKQEVAGVSVKVEKKEEREYAVRQAVAVDNQHGSRGQKNLHREDIDLKEGRSNKQSAVGNSEGNAEKEIFDMVLLCNRGKSKNPLADLQEALQNGVNKHAQNVQLKGLNGMKSRGKKLGKREVVDLRALLVQCAQAVATDDRRSASELLKQIRQHSSPFGDGSQRLAHSFAESLEARISGTGSQIYTALSTKRTSAAGILKAYHLYLAACPFKKLSHFFGNQTIMNAAENATRLHIVDFGILYGFQWPCLIQRLSGRPGGPPHLRITGIDLPQPGFRPSERIEETGDRLKDYARRFNVPFVYKAIAAKWETVTIEDLNLDNDEVLVVNCLYRFKNLVDETVVVNSPRNIVLNTIKKANPKVFIHGVVNGAYSAPFFITRFREALFHFSALFDMLETNVPREHPERILIEREIFGREVLNVIACEGSERIERPETYKQWQVRTQRAGFTQLPLNQDILKRARDKVKLSYHKDFVVDEDGKWMLQGWKGRILYSISTWRTDNISF